MAKSATDGAGVSAGETRLLNRSRPSPAKWIRQAETASAEAGTFPLEAAGLTIRRLSRFRLMGFGNFQTNVASGLRLMSVMIPR